MPPVGCGESPDWDAEIPLIDADRSLFPATTQLIAVKGQPDQRIVHECAGSGRAVGVIVLSKPCDAQNTRKTGSLTIGLLVDLLDPGVEVLQHGPTLALD